jgi:TonB family protein
MSDHHHKKQFLNLPKYIGGSVAYKEFIAANLRYPDAALREGVEGSVIVEFDIHDSGDVRNPRVLKGIGHGCNEEAMRVVGLLKYEKVRNRGLRVKVTTKTTINFRLPAGTMKINYASAPENKPAVTDENTQPKPGPVVYEYTISF